MKTPLILLTSVACFAATSVTNITATNTQAVMRIKTDQTGACTIKVSEVNDFSGAYVPVHDVNTTFFTGSDQCSRTGNISSTGQLVLVIGKRAAELSAAGVNRYSRALQTLTTYYYSITVGADTVTGNFKTRNIPLGNTHNDSRFDRSRPGEYAFPTITDWTPGNLAAKTGKYVKYIDPHTGIAVRRLGGPGELIPTAITGRVFTELVNRGTTWTVGSASAATFTGATGQALFLRADTTSSTLKNYMSLDSAQLTATLSGTVTSVDVCLTNDGMTCVGGTINQPITGTATAYTIGTTTPILSAWRNSPNYPSNMDDVVPRIGTVIKTGTALQWISGIFYDATFASGPPGTRYNGENYRFTDASAQNTCTGGGTSIAHCEWNGSTWIVATAARAANYPVNKLIGTLFNPKWSNGSIVDLNGIPCTISSFGDDENLTLASAGCAADGPYRYTGRNWGFLLKSASSGNITMTGAAWNTATTGQAIMPSAGYSRNCSKVKVTGPTGPGHVCSSGPSYEIYPTGIPIWFFGDDGTINFIGFQVVSVGATGLASGSCGGESVKWDNTVAGKYYCLGTVSGAPVVYSVTYTGTYAAIVPAIDQSLSPATVTVESGNLTTLTNTFTASDLTKFSNFTCAGWTLSGVQAGGLNLQCFEGIQDTPGWVAFYDIAAHNITAAMSTYGGGDNSVNRWASLHTLVPAGDSNWFLIYPQTMGFSIGGNAGYESSITAGTLNSTFSVCPTNTIVPAVAGTTACSALTLGSITPTYLGASYKSQTWRIGDTAMVMNNGVQDAELVKIITISGLDVVVIRNFRPYWTGTNTSHAGTIKLQAYFNSIQVFWWDYVNDPHAQSLTNGTGATIREDPDVSDCHEIYESPLFLGGCLKIGYPNGMIIRTGDLPQNFTNQYVISNVEGFFGASTYILNLNLDETHPSAAQYNATPLEKTKWFDARTYMGDPAIALAGNITHPGTYIWKLTAAATATMNYKEQGFLGLTGTLPLVDSSPTVLADSTADNFKYCRTVIAGDCFAGSLVGEVYFNLPYVTNPFVTISRFVPNPFTDLRDISLTQNVHPVHSIIQGGSSRNDPQGAATRKLSSGFAPHKTQSTYWTIRALPDASRFFWLTDRLERVRNELMIADLPPTPPEESTNRGAWATLPVSTGGVTGDTIRIRFGYAENGPPTSLLCHERQVACATDATGTAPFLWTDETQQFKACGSGCTVNIPAISGRVVYYQIDRKNGASTTTGALEAIAVP